MALTIERFNSRCRVSPRARVGRREIERVVREDVGGAWARALGGSWAEGEAVVRIPRLRVELTLAAEAFTTGAAAEQWARALAEALWRALAGGRGEIVRAGSRAEWLGRYLLEVRAGTARDRWEYAEFGPHSGGPVEICLAALAREAAVAPAALGWIAAQGQLARWLADWSEPALEKLCALLSAGQPAPETTGEIFSTPYLVRVARAAHRFGLVAGGRIASRRRAIHLSLTPGGEAACASTAEDLFEALLTLELLLNHSTTDTSPLPRGLPLRVLASCREARRSATEHPENVALESALDLLRPTEAGAEASASASWIASEAAGLFLLVDRIERLRWLPLGQRTPLAAVHGPRLDGYLLAGIALAILGRAGEEPMQVDPAVALFAGWLGEPNLGAFRDFQASATSADRLAVLEALLGDECPPIPPAATWTFVFTALAAKLVLEFAATLRAFRQPSHAFIVETFLAVAGRLLLEKDCVSVALAPNSYRIVLRIAGADGPVESVSWLDGRRLLFVPETS